MGIENIDDDQRITAVPEVQEGVSVEFSYDALSDDEIEAALAQERTEEAATVNAASDKVNELEVPIIVDDDGSTLVPEPASVNELITSVLGSDWSSKEKSFSIPTDERFLLLLIERGEKELVCHKLKHFEELGSYIFAALIEMEGGLDIFFENISKFKLKLSDLGMLDKRDLKADQLFFLVKLLGENGTVFLEENGDDRKNLLEEFVAKFKDVFDEDVGRYRNNLDQKKSP
jgi:hypothetical protein